MVRLLLDAEADLRADPVLRALDRERFGRCFGNSLAISAVVVPLSLILGLAGAVLLTRWRSRANGLLWWVLLSPMLAPGVILGLSALVFWGRLGVDAGLFTIVMAQVTFIAGYPLLILMARLQRQPVELEEAALDLGASPFRVFRRITLPFLLPALASAAVIAFMASMENYNTTMFAKGGACILAVGLPEDFEPPHAPAFVPVEGQESGAQLAARARAAGAFVAIAHPEWSGLTTEDARMIEAAHAVEVYNHGCAIGCDRPHGFYTLDQLLTEGRDLTLCATDDAHFTEPDHFGGWVMVKADENDPDALLDALKEGAFFSSTGPEIRGIHWEDRQVIVETSAVRSVVVQGCGSAAAAVHGASMTRTSVPLERFHNSDWMRVSVIDAAGRRAWANPMRRAR